MSSRFTRTAVGLGITAGLLLTSVGALRVDADDKARRLAVDSTAPEPPPGTYATTSFAIPFEVTAPEWSPVSLPSAQRPHLVTWESPDRAVRFLAPVTVLQPPDATGTEVPDDYVAYLLSQSEFGASFDDVVETTIDGRPATIVSATTANEIGGSLGCEGHPPGVECWGLVPQYPVRLAVIDTENGPLLVWDRGAENAAPIDDGSFDEMLASLHFPEDVVPPTAAPVATTEPHESDPRLPDGEYRTAELTPDQLIDAAVANGLDQADAEAFVGGDGGGIDDTARFGLRLADGWWTQLYSYDGGPYGIGSEGTFEVVDDDTVTTTVAGCDFTYAFDGEQLTLDLVDDSCSGEGDRIALTIIFGSAPLTLS
jgi:hypothetical protein